jgi:nucleoid-associated protein YgaU
MAWSWLPLKTVALSSDIKIPEAKESRAGPKRAKGVCGMSAWGAIGPGTRILVLALGGGALVGAGYLVWQSAQPVEPMLSVEETPAQTTPVAEPEAQADIAADPVAQPAPDVATVVPKIDTWRVAPDGEALVAGKAIPGSTVAVVVDDRPVAEGVALSSGEFVLQFTLAPNPAPSLLWLSMTPLDGSPVASPEIVAIAPIEGPRLAVADPEPTPVPGTEPAIAPVEPAGPTVQDTAEVGPDNQPQPEPPADAAPTALLMTEEGAVVLQDDAASDPAFADQVMIDTIAYAPTGAVQVGGRGDAGAALRLYLDNAEVAIATVATDGRWLVTLGDSAPGIYMLRVDQIDAAGNVTSRFETPFKRETLDALALAAGTAPADEAAAPAADFATAEAPVDPTVPSAPETAAAVSPDATASATSLAIAASQAVTITVQPGFTLWGIAQERLGDGVFYVQVFEANRDKIKDPNLIYPGQVFSIPETPAP